MGIRTTSVPKADPEKLVSFIVASIVGSDKKSTVMTTEGADLIKLEIKVPQEDFGKIVGKGGATIWAIRRLAQIAGATLGKKILVTLSE